MDDVKRINTCIIGVPAEEREKGAGKLFADAIDENFTDLGKETDIQVQETEFQTKGTKVGTPPLEHKNKNVKD